MSSLNKLVSVSFAICCRWQRTNSVQHKCRWRRQWLRNSTEWHYLHYEAAWQGNKIFVQLGGDGHGSSQSDTAAPLVHCPGRINV